MKNMTIGLLIILLLATTAQAADISNALQIFAAWTLGEKFQIINHELGHANCACGSRIQYNFNLFRSSGLTFWPGTHNKTARLRVCKAGLEASERLYHSTMSRLENTRDKFGQQVLAITGLLSLMDFPVYVATGKDNTFGPNGSNTNDISNIQSLLGKDDGYMRRRALAVVMLNTINIRDLTRAALGKGYRKRSKRLWATCDGESFWAGITFNH